MLLANSTKDYEPILNSCLECSDVYIMSIHDLKPKPLHLAWIITEPFLPNPTLIVIRPLVTPQCQQLFAVMPKICY